MWWSAYDLISQSHRSYLLIESVKLRSPFLNANIGQDIRNPNAFSRYVTEDESAKSSKAHEIKCKNFCNLDQNNVSKGLSSSKSAEKNACGGSVNSGSKNISISMNSKKSLRRPKLDSPSSSRSDQKTGSSDVMKTPPLKCSSKTNWKERQGPEKWKREKKQYELKERPIARKTKQEELLDKFQVHWFI